MRGDGLALIDLLADLPEAADYDAIYAALMASARGRQFLSEFARRNRNADTQVVVQAIARVEAAARGGTASERLVSVGQELSEIAESLDLVQASLAAGADLPRDITVVLERLQDIAFVLHERPVELSLCDALDAAIRELAAAFDHVGRALEGASRNSSAQLRALADRIRGLGVALGGAYAAGERRPEVTAPPEEAGRQQGAVAVTDEPLTTPQPEVGASGIADAAIVPTLERSRPTTAEPFPAAAFASHGGASAEHAAPPALSGTILDQALANGNALNSHSEDAGPADATTEGHSETDSTAPPRDLLPIQEFTASAAAPNASAEDFAFDPLPMPSPLATDPASPAPTSGAADDAGASAEASLADQAAPMAAARTTTQPEPSDPLAAIRGLSEDELLALFS